MSQIWKKCSSCKKGIICNSTYYKCSVSTCNSKRAGYQFCSVSCWSSHVPIFRHKSAWAEEEQAPSAPDQVSSNTKKVFSSKASVKDKNSLSTVAAQSSSTKTSYDKEVLIVVSKVKGYLKELSGMNMSADVLPVLSSHVRASCRMAVEEAKRSGRKTVMARDFK